jgi:hypothetical protein
LFPHGQHEPTPTPSHRGRNKLLEVAFLVIVFLLLVNVVFPAVAQQLAASFLPG